jgi:para-aminobenzoate synthetase/4-amino-4-deoxychorismate lyase
MAKGLGTALGARNRAAALGGLREGARAAKQWPVKRPTDLEVILNFDPDEGISDLDRHLDQLKEAAEAQGFKFDRHATRNELQAATFGKRRPVIARLLLSPTGAMAIEVRPA